MTAPDEAAAIVERRRRVAIAGHRGEVDVARAHRDDPDPDVRAMSLGALARLDALTSDDLVAAARDGSAIVRRRACEEAARWQTATPLDGSVATAIALLLDDADDSVVEVAAWSIGERPPAPAAVIARLAEITISHDEPLCRESAVAALGALGDPAGLAAILHATGDRATVRRRAVLALAPFEGPEVDDALRRALDDRDWQVRQAAEDLGAGDLSP